MLAGRPHEAAGNGSPRWMIAAPPQAGAQNPAYRPTHPHNPLLTCGVALSLAVRGKSRAHREPYLDALPWYQPRSEATQPAVCMLK
jgi:hypothetical protein